MQFNNKYLRWLKNIFIFQQIILFLLFSIATAFNLIPKENAIFAPYASYLPIIGLGEFIALCLFVYPRTMLIGALYLSAHVGGCVAARISVEMPVLIPLVSLASLWFTIFLRTPHYFISPKAIKRIDSSAQENFHTQTT